MNNTPSEVLAELRQRLHDYLLGNAHADADRMGLLVRANWPLAAQIEQLRRHPLVAVLDDELLAAIAAREIDPNVEARYLAMRLREVEAEAAAESGNVDAQAASSSELPPTALDQMEATLALIARDCLGFEVLHDRGSEDSDFRSCSVGSILAALIEAYEEGWHAAP